MRATAKPGELLLKQNGATTSTVPGPALRTLHRSPEPRLRTVTTALLQLFLLKSLPESILHSDFTSGACLSALLVTSKEISPSGRSSQLLVSILSHRGLWQTP